MPDSCHTFQALLSRHHDGDAPHPGTDHLAQCPDCAAFAAHLTRLSHAFTPAAVPLAPSLRARLLRHADAGQTPVDSGARPAWFAHPWFLPALGGACLLIIMLIGPALFSPTRQAHDWQILPQRQPIPHDGIRLSQGQAITLVSPANGQLTLWGGPAHLQTATVNGASQALELITGTSCFRWKAPTSERFAVVCRSLQVVTKGTVFRVRQAADGSVEVAVDQGEVEVRPPHGDPVSVSVMRTLTWSPTSGSPPTPALFNPMADPDFQDLRNLSVVER